MEPLPLREYQKQGVHFLKSRDRAMLCDDPGLGKTRQMIECCKLQRYRTLVICPRTIKSEWKDEIEKWTDMRAIIIEGKPTMRRLLYRMRADFHIVNYEIVLRDCEYINKIPFDCIVLDEAQRIKNHKTQTAKVVKKLKGPRYRYVLTATPIENRIEELFSLIEFIGNGTFEDIERSLLSDKGGYSGYFNIAWGGRRRRLRKSMSRAHPDTIHKALSKYMLRRRKSDVDIDLPPKTHISIETSLTEKQQEMYELAKEEFLLIVDDTAIPITTVLAQFTYLREICNSTALLDPAAHHSSKMEELIPRVEEIVEGGNKVIIFSEFKRMCDIIVSALREKDIGVSYLHGQERAPESQKRAFWEKNQVMVATRTGEAGHNLQCASYVFHFEPAFNPARIKQREDRAHRMGQENPVIVYGFVTPDSIEERIISILQQKQELFTSVIDKPEYRVWLRDIVL